MKVGIMGGTFDPIHNGHISIAKIALDQYSLDYIWFLPNGNPPHKSNALISSSVNDRVQMIRLAIDKCPYFCLEEYEIRDKKVSYSYKTMEYLTDKYKDYEFYFILGADSLFSLEDWKYPNRLMDVCTILVAYREENDTRDTMYSHVNYLKNKYNADIKLIKSPIIDISSHEIRNDLEKGIDISDKLPESVYTYIESNNLYKVIL
ncbi:MAG: nicotinate-nucleotide adenylyltransferase [Suipraeoptans sp.]